MTLGGSNACRRAAVTAIAPQPHFGEYQNRAIGQDQIDLAQAAAGKHLTDDELSNRETELWAAEERIVSASAALTRAEDVALSARGEDLPDACIVSMDAAGRIRYVRVGADSGLDRARTELADALAGRQALIQDAVAHASR